jgi:predicted short-subunit dehydrogenase-like oxidoreductase (DUF2520 family)
LFRPRRRLRTNRAVSGICGRTGTGRCFIDTEVTSLRFAVVGAGQLGASLALALRAKGLTLVAFTARTAEGRCRAESWLGGSALSDLREVVSLEPDLYLITVPDSALAAVASELGGLLIGRPPCVVAHTSGATSVKALDPCALAGATTLVFHPLQTFTDPAAGCGRFSDAAVAVTPADVGDPPGAALGFALARLLGAHPFLLGDDKRSLYHAAAAMACNYFVTLEHSAREIFVQSGLPSDQALSLFLPLVRATLDNMEVHGTVNSLTGPLSRGDVSTVSGHLAALAARAPHLLPVYRDLGLCTLHIVRARGEVAASTIEELYGLLGPSQPGEPHIATGENLVYP